MKIDSPHSQYTKLLDVLLPTGTYLMHITQQGPLFTMCAKMDPQGTQQFVSFLTHDMKMGAHYYERPHVPPSYSSECTISYICHVKMDALHCECVYASSRSLEMEMHIPHYECTDASAVCHLKDFLHIWHENGRSPKWLGRCKYTEDCLLKDFLHTWQEKGCSPVWVRICVSKSYSKEKSIYTHHMKMDALQCEHAYIPSRYPGIWKIYCIYYVRKGVQWYEFRNAASCSAAI